MSDDGIDGLGLCRRAGIYWHGKIRKRGGRYWPADVVFEACNGGSNNHDDDICNGVALYMQMGNEPKIIIWDTATMQTVKVLKGFHKRAVTLLVGVCDGDDQNCLFSPIYHAPRLSS